MNKDSIHNVNIVGEKVLITPSELKEKLPLTAVLRHQIEQSRRDIANIIHKKDPRLLIVIGPCSIHDTVAALEYAQRLRVLAEELKDTLYIVMRVYFEKPRTTIGWKGLINDPKIDGSFDVERGLHISRDLLLQLAEIGLPLATEALDPITPQYMADLFSWSAIGARTTESQTHREMSSGLSMAVGFKNGTDGSLSTAINAMKAASMGHSFIGINQQGQVNLLHTAGNPHGHVILRGGKMPNYQAEFVQQCERELEHAGLESAIMIDCSHGNSNKDYRHQPIVAEDALQQIVDGNQSIIGLMLESHLFAGNQSAEQPVSKMKYGVSITDACMDWDTSEKLLRQMARKLKRIKSK